jgi:hypothetical protein
MAQEEYGISVTIDAELDRFRRNMRQAGELVETSTNDMDRSTRRAKRSFERLEGALDPASRALQRYRRDTEKVERALQKNAISADRAAEVQRRLNLQYEQSVGTARRASRGTSAFGTSAQNAAFQVGDFATQVASGQSATRALAQQLPQLLGGFGVFGAVVGAAVAVGGALVPILFDLGEGANEAAEGNNTYKDSLEAIEEIQKRVNDQSLTRIERLRKEGQAALEGAEAEVQAAQERLKALAIQNEQDLFGAGRRQRSQEQQVEAAQELVEAQERLQELRERLNKTIEQARQQEAEDAAGGGGGRDGGAMSAADKYGIPDQDALARLEEQIRLQKMSARERAQAQAVMQAQNEAMKQGNLLGQQEVELIRQRAGTLFDLRNAATDAANEVKKAQDITERYSEEIQALESIGDRAFSRIGSAITQMAVEGQDAMVSLRNIGNAVVSELMQAFIELAAINPLKNALLGGDRATLSGVGGLIGELIGGAATGGTAPAIGAGGGVSFSAQASAPGATVGGVGFADGGSFTVGSQFPTINAGRDNRLVTVPMRDGERVDVTPAGMDRGGGGGVEVNIYGGGDTEPQVTRSRKANGQTRLDIALRQQNKQDIAGGAYDREMRARYGLTPQTGGR